MRWLCSPGCGGSEKSRINLEPVSEVGGWRTGSAGRGDNGWASAARSSAIASAPIRRTGSARAVLAFVGLAVGFSLPFRFTPPPPGTSRSARTVALALKKRRERERERERERSTPRSGLLGVQRSTAQPSRVSSSPPDSEILPICNDAAVRGHGGALSRPAVPAPTGCHCGPGSLVR
jgi:hypothetical protein